MSKKDYLDYFIDNANKEQKHTWRCEPKIKSTLDVFAELRPECVPRGSKSSLYSGARFLVTEVGENDAPLFVRLADEVMRNEKLEVKSPRSYAWLLPKWRRGELKDEQSEQSRRRYTEGL